MKKYDLISGYHTFEFHMGDNNSHEATFMTQLLCDIKDDPVLALEFSIYVYEFYPDFKWMVPFLPSLEKVAFEAGNAVKVLEYYCRCHHPNLDIKHEMEFGEIVTDFYIRYKDYTIVGISDQKVVVTSSKWANVDFSSYINEGYWIEIKKAVKKKEHIDDSGRLYEYYPSVPIREYDNDTIEYLETSRDKFARVFKPYNCLKDN